MLMLCGPCCGSRPTNLTFQGSYFTGTFETAVGGTLTLDPVNNWWTSTFTIAGGSVTASPACTFGAISFIRVFVVDNLDGTYGVYYDQGQVDNCSGLSCLVLNGVWSGAHVVIVRKTGTVTSTAAGPTLAGVWPTPTNQWDTNPTGCPSGAWVAARLDNTLGFTVHP